VLGRLDEVATVTGFLVTPVVCANRRGTGPAAACPEVERVLHVPLAVLRDPGHWFEDERVLRGETYRLRSCRYGGDVIWAPLAHPAALPRRRPPDIL